MINRYTNKRLYPLLTVYFITKNNVQRSTMAKVIIIIVLLLLITYAPIVFPIAAILAIALLIYSFFYFRGEKFQSIKGAKM